MVMAAGKVGQSSGPGRGLGPSLGSGGQRFLGAERRAGGATLNHPNMPNDLRRFEHDKENIPAKPVPPKLDLHSLAAMPESSEDDEEEGHLLQILTKLKTAKTVINETREK